MVSLHLNKVLYLAKDIVRRWMMVSMVHLITTSEMDQFWNELQALRWKEQSLAAQVKKIGQKKVL